MIKRLLILAMTRPRELAQMAGSALALADRQTREICFSTSVDFARSFQQPPIQQADTQLDIVFVDFRHSPMVWTEWLNRSPESQSRRTNSESASP